MPAESDAESQLLISADTNADLQLLTSPKYHFTSKISMICEDVLAFEH